MTGLGQPPIFAPLKKWIFCYLMSRSTTTCCEKHKEEIAMPNSIYRVTEIVGTSTRSWEDAAKRAIETAAKSLRELRVAEVSDLDVTIENGKVQAYRAKVKLSFKFEAAPTAAAPKKKAAKKKKTRRR
jgi:hypothetical protein